MSHCVYMCSIEVVTYTCQHAKSLCNGSSEIYASLAGITHGCFGSARKYITSKTLFYEYLCVNVCLIEQKTGAEVMTSSSS